MEEGKHGRSSLALSPLFDLTLSIILGVRYVFITRSLPEVLEDVFHSLISVEDVFEGERGLAWPDGGFGRDAKVDLVPDVGRVVVVDSVGDFGMDQ